MKTNEKLKEAVKASKKALIPETYINRIWNMHDKDINPSSFRRMTQIGIQAYMTVSGQNSNNSVRITDAFCKLSRTVQIGSCCEELMWKVDKVIKAAELWDQIGHAAWSCADPGIQFHDTINDWHTP